MKPRYAIFLAGVALAATLHWQSQPAAQQTSGRSPAAEAALARGFAMAQRKQWSLAIKYFRAAREAAPTDSVVLFNLALAHDRAGGRELVTAAWYQAFLASSPASPNAAKVKKRVVDLEIRTETQILKLVETAERIAGQISGNDRDTLYGLVARAHAQNGDIDAARRRLAKIASPGRRNWPQAVIASSYAQKGDFRSARSMIAGVRFKPARNWGLAEIAVGLAAAKQYRGAAEIADAIGNGKEKDWAYSRITALQLKDNDIKGATESSAKIRQVTGTYRITADLAAAVALIGTELPWQVEKAKNYLAKVNASIDGIQNTETKALTMLQAVRAYAQIGDTAGARALIEKMPQARFKNLALSALKSVEGNKPQAKIYRWTAFAVHAENNSVMDDIRVILDRAKNKKPGVAGGITAFAAEERARMLRSFRKLTIN